MKFNRTGIKNPEAATEKITKASYCSYTARIHRRNSDLARMTNDSLKTMLRVEIPKLHCCVF